MKNERRKISRAEIVFLTVVLLVAVIIFLVLKMSQSGLNTAWINYGGEDYPVPLDEKRVFKLSELQNNAPEMSFEVKDGEIAVISSDCPGNDCVHTGYIPDNGRVIICAPNRVTVTVSNDNIMYDAVI
jgi:hypothetical protein